MELQISMEKGKQFWGLIFLSWEANQFLTKIMSPFLCFNEACNHIIPQLLAVLLHDCIYFISAAELHHNG